MTRRTLRRAVDRLEAHVGAPVVDVGAPSLSDADPFDAEFVAGYYRAAFEVYGLDVAARQLFAVDLERGRRFVTRALVAVGFALEEDHATEADPIGDVLSDYQPALAVSPHDPGPHSDAGADLERALGSLADRIVASEGDVE